MIGNNFAVFITPWNLNSLRRQVLQEGSMDNQREDGINVRGVSRVKWGGLGPYHN